MHHRINLRVFIACDLLQGLVTRLIVLCATIVVERDVGLAERSQIWVSSKHQTNWLCLCTSCHSQQLNPDWAETAPVARTANSATNAFLEFFIFIFLIEVAYATLIQHRFFSMHS